MSMTWTFALTQGMNRTFMTQFIALQNPCAKPTENRRRQHIYPSSIISSPEEDPIHAASAPNNNVLTIRRRRYH